MCLSQAEADVLVEGFHSKVTNPGYSAAMSKKYYIRTIDYVGTQRTDTAVQQFPFRSYHRLQTQTKRGRPCVYAQNAIRRLADSAYTLIQDEKNDG